MNKKVSCFSHMANGMMGSLLVKDTAHPVCRSSSKLLMACQSYKWLLTRLLHGRHANITKRLAWRTFTSRHSGCHGDLSRNFLTRTSVHRKCSVCWNYHNSASGDSVNADNVFVETNSDSEIPRVDTSKKTLGTKSRRPDKKSVQNTDLHIPVLKEEVLSYLGGKVSQRLVDMTFGAGGHTKALLDSAPDCHVFALDRDPLAYKIACELAEQRPGQITPLLGRFSELPTLLAARDVPAGSIDGMLFDLGSSSMQFDQSERGFSLSMDGPLDMRMDSNRLREQPTAADVVNSLDEVDLAKIFKKYGEERRAKRIAHAIAEARSAFGRITRTRELAKIVESVCVGVYGHDSLGRYSHPATKIFQALRIFVNNEMNELNSGLEVAHKFLKPRGICVAISFHSLEDRIVKRHFNTIDMDEKGNLSLVQKHRMMSRMADTKDQLDSMVVRKWQRLNKKVTMSSEEEVEVNPRSRSAKLRAAEKLQV
ncbi:probable methyltransferase-like protein 15 homolog isoform X2 [Mercenaria mercenaria]|uniref:probable methyltransferase-like protein 15 homolog isoform X2 n=1 Tax=Mercenaria mercenaria TaxID=6596 RepID=UPI00234EA2E6|nr:probable methyltransferase-like protein 15 homolog isoform X2 [Mercenaria mercenaria]